jgi:hypothetical protein
MRQGVASTVFKSRTYKPSEFLSTLVSGGPNDEHFLDLIEQLLSISDVAFDGVNG